MYCRINTRRWFFKINFKTDEKRYNEVVDVYELASSFSASLLDHVCRAYAAHLGVKFDRTFELKLEDHNFINTLLEIDLFPGLFSDWWEEECQPLNFGVRFELSEGQRHNSNDQFHRWVYENLTPDIAAYKASLEHFAALAPQAIFEKENFGDFLSFVLTNHWHYKRAFGGGLRESGASSSNVMQLQRAGNIFVEEFRKGKLCTIESTKQSLNEQIHKTLGKIDTEESGKA